MGNGNGYLPDYMLFSGNSNRKLAEEVHDFRCFGPGMKQFVMDVVARHNTR